MPGNGWGPSRASAQTRFSAFQDLLPQVQDFGRNGGFLAIRQFEQHVDNFHRYAERCTEKVQDVARPQDLVGGAITAEWVEAKLMGRWHDGAPLIDRPIAPAQRIPEEAAETHVGEADEKGQILTRADQGLGTRAASATCASIPIWISGSTILRAFIAPSAPIFAELTPVAVGAREQLATDDYQPASPFATWQGLSTRRRKGTSVHKPVHRPRAPV
jgi:hypothetical protein